MPFRIRHRRVGASPGSIAALLLAALASLARAQTPSNDYEPPVHVAEDDVALQFIAGRYTSPVSCKKTDGSVIEVENSIVLRLAPESAGGGALKVTFFGIDVSDVDYCYTLVERRVPDRRGTFFAHYRSHNRKDLGTSDFRRALAAGPLTYNAHRGELKVQGIGSEADPANARVLAFDGDDARFVVETIPHGSDGAKLLADYESRSGPVDPNRRRFTFRFIAKDGSEFLFYGVQALRGGK